MDAGPAPAPCAPGGVIRPASRSPATWYIRPMLEDVQAVAAFYRTPRGRLVASLLRRRLQAVWPDLSRQDLLGLGHTAPFLSLWRDQLHRCVDAATSAGPVLPGASCLVHDDALPFPDATFDRVLMVHARPHRTSRAPCAPCGAPCATTGG